MSFDTWALFALAAGAVLATPGPTIMIVCAYALSAGRGAGLWLALGVCLGDLAAITAALIGLGALLESSAALFTALRWAGAAYPIYLGVMLWRAPHEPEAAEVDLRRAGPRMAAHAFLVTATNPKSILFFVSFLPLFIDAERPFAPQAVLVTATFVGLAALNAGLYALLADQMRRRLMRPGALKWVNRTGGAALIGMGIAAALTRRAA